jgi:hypothetical protein
MARWRAFGADVLPTFGLLRLTRLTSSGLNWAWDTPYSASHAQGGSSHMRLYVTGLQESRCGRLEAWQYAMKTVVGDDE